MGPFLHLEPIRVGNLEGIHKYFLIIIIAVSDHPEKDCGTVSLEEYQDMGVVTQLLPLGLELLGILR